MRQKAGHLGTDYLFPKLHSLWAESLQGDALREMLNSGGRRQFDRYLSSLGIEPAERAFVQKRLTIRLVDHLAHVAALLECHFARLYHIFLQRYFVDNLKTLLTHWYVPAADVRVEDLLVESPALPQIDVQRALESRTVHRFYAALPRTPLTERLLPLLVELDDTRDIFAAECKLDAMWMDLLNQTAREVSGKGGGIAAEFAGMESDIVNMVIVLRNAEIYGLSDARIDALCVAGGRYLDAEHLQAMRACDGREAMLSCLPRPYRHALERHAAAALYVCENALWNVLFDRVRDAFRDYQQPAGTLVAYPWLRRFETLNLARLYEGFYFDLTPAEIRSMMIGMEGNV